jgi:hypothetical protein
VHWRVHTDQGARRFQTRLDDWPRKLPDGGLLIRDVTAIFIACVTWLGWTVRAARYSGRLSIESTSRSRRSDHRLRAAAATAPTGLRTDSSAATLSAAALRPDRLSARCRSGTRSGTSRSYGKVADEVMELAIRAAAVLRRTATPSPGGMSRRGVGHYTCYGRTGYEDDGSLE